MSTEFTDHIYGNLQINSLQNQQYLYPETLFQNGITEFHLQNPQTEGIYIILGGVLTENLQKRTGYSGKHLQNFTKSKKRSTLGRLQNSRGY